MKKESIKQFVKFGVIGILNTLINMFVLYVLTEYFHVYYMLSAVFAFIVAVTNSFIFNKIWTFKESIKYRVFSKYAKFFVVSLMALGVNLCLLYVFTELAGFYYMLSQLLAIGVSFWINFFINKLWTFKK